MNEHQPPTTDGFLLADHRERWQQLRSVLWWWERDLEELRRLQRRVDELEEKAKTKEQAR